MRPNQITLYLITSSTVMDLSYQDPIDQSTSSAVTEQVPTVSKSEDDDLAELKKSPFPILDLIIWCR